MLQYITKHASENTIREIISKINIDLKADTIYFIIFKDLEAVYNRMLNKDVNPISIKFVNKQDFIIRDNWVSSEVQKLESNQVMLAICVEDEYHPLMSGNFNF